MHSSTTRLDASSISFSRKALAAVLSFGMIALTACSGSSQALPASPTTTNTTTALGNLQGAIAAGDLIPACPSAVSGTAVRCNVYTMSAAGLAIFKVSSRPPASLTSASRRKSAVAPPTAVSGLQPSDLQSAYNLTSISASQGSGRTVAVIEAYNDPIAESDLGVYRSTFGLPACTIASGCLTVVNQSGSVTSLPPSDTTVAGNWGIETSYDVDMVSAICPNCHILIVEANTATMPDLAAGVQTAVRLGAFSISNSYSANETGNASYASAFNHPGTPITAAAGDAAYSFGVAVPASYGTVVAVGATTLTRDPSSVRGWDETVAVSGATTSGCSTITAKPSWQTDVGCSMRTVADISFFGDPSTCFSAYFGAWACGTGTSLGAPAIAAIYALAGYSGNASSFYNPGAGLNPIISGSNGTLNQAGACVPPAPQAPGNVGIDSLLRHPDGVNPDAYLCTAGPGYNGPAGNGTPNGINGFGVSLCPTVPPQSTPNPHPTENPNAPAGCTS